MTPEQRHKLRGMLNSLEAAASKGRDCSGKINEIMSYVGTMAGEQ